MSELEQVLAKYFTESYGKKAPTGTPTTNNVHGPGGIFGVAGLDQQVISARIAPRGVAQMLTVNPTVYTDPLYPYITGMEFTNSTQPTGVCDTCVSVETESCIQTAPLGRVCVESKELEINRTFQRINPGEMDLQLVNSILGQDTSFVPGPSQKESALNMAVAWAMVEAGVGMQNLLTPMVWNGNPGNNTAGGGYKEFIGLDTLIGTNKVDAITGTRCSALDSDVKEFAYNLIGSTDAAGNYMIVRFINMVSVYVKHNAERQGLMPVQWAWAIRPEAWQELLEVWPVAYYSTRQLALPAGNTNFIDGAKIAMLREDMRNGMFIDTAAGRFPVVTDDGIFEHDSTNDANVPAGSFASTFYFLPLTYLGNRPATYFEHLDYRQALPEIRSLNETDSYWVTDNGRFMWTQEQLKWCFTVSGKIEPRIVLRTPQLAGKIEHVLYTPVQHLRGFDEDSDYFYKGGVPYRDSPSLWNDANYASRGQ
jgi:hypothetical protein